jgi:glycosyltransferase involved in cell wall biosynthesis
MNVVLTSYTPLGAPGGVPRFNRDLIGVLPKARHYSWFDMLRELAAKDSEIAEWDKARALNTWLRRTGRVTADDIVITDGFWGLGLEDFPKVVSVAHGNWSHTTKDDVDRGVPPEFPRHHAVQVGYRKNHLANGGRIVAVSDFIAHQCKIQWGFEMPVINNGIDLKKFVPTTDRKPRKRPVIVHGTTTTNKGFDHIEHLKKHVDADVILLDEAPDFFKLPKYPALSQADLVVHPSAHEGNSFFLLETLASGVPIVSYDVGLMYRAARGPDPLVGSVILDRRSRSKEVTLGGVERLLEPGRDLSFDGSMARYFAEAYSTDVFRKNWLDYLVKEFGYDSLQS